MLPEDKIDQNIFRYFREVVHHKYKDINDEELEAVAYRAYKEFVIYLVQQFKDKVHFDNTQADHFREMYSAGGGRTAVLNYLNSLSESNVDESLDKLLVDILNSFVQKFFNS